MPYEIKELDKKYALTDRAYRESHTSMNTLKSKINKIMNDLEKDGNDDSEELKEAVAQIKALSIEVANARKYYNDNNLNNNNDDDKKFSWTNLVGGKSKRRRHTKRKRRTKKRRSTKKRRHTKKRRARKKNKMS